MRALGAARRREPGRRRLDQPHDRPGARNQPSDETGERPIADALLLLASP